ncbi:MAG: hypothetical protein JJ992_04055 [Planctomycetes bacterium]|nr:hypothetical protein [Planctomycetota bacterium]
METAPKWLNKLGHDKLGHDKLRGVETLPAGTEPLGYSLGLRCYTNFTP